MCVPVFTINSFYTFPYPPFFLYKWYLVNKHKTSQLQHYGITNRLYEVVGQ